MSVNKLTIHNFRNLTNQTVEFHPSLNFITGNNGSGKSSLLESIFYLAHGKSFRAPKADSLVSYEQNDFVVSVKDNFGNQLGVSKSIKGGQTFLKVNGEKLNKLSELAKHIAVQIVTPESFKLFFGGPKDRRKFIDFGMFHVKHDFSTQWKEFSRVLKQRNACLKHKDVKSLNSYWSDSFIELSIILTEKREQYVHLFKAEFEHWLKYLLPELTQQIEVSFHQGWSRKQTLKEVLTKNIDRELAMGFSLYGAHKFDVKFLIDGTSVEHQLSRGQQKLFLLALTFTQTKLIERVNRVKPILLIDDIGAELDQSSRCNFYNAIENVDCQVIITAIDKVALEPMVQNDNTLKMFHVKHGRISEVNK